MAYDYRKDIYFQKELVETKPMVCNNVILDKDINK